jgi:hypothetical protein
MYDNIISRNVILRVAGPDIAAGDTLSGAINLPSDDPLIPAPYDFNDSGTWEILFSNVAVGYDLYYTVSVMPSNPAASGTYNISNEDGIMINPPVSSPERDLLIGVEAKRPE